MKVNKIWFDDCRIYLTTDTGTTGNRNSSPSGSISSLFRIVLTAISSYCFTVGLLRSAHRVSG